MVVTETSWEKGRSGIKIAAQSRLKFLIIGVVLFGAIAFFLVTGTANGGRFFFTINEMLARPEMTGKSVKISVAVVGTTIKFDAETKTIHFSMANITNDSAELEKQIGLAKALHMAVMNLSAKQMDAVIHNQA